MDAFLKGVSAKPKDAQPSGSGTATSTKEIHKRKTLQPWVEKQYVIVMFTKMLQIYVHVSAAAAVAWIRFAQSSAKAVLHAMQQLQIH